MKLIDTHQHLWDLKQFPYSWCAPFPKLNRTFGLADYLEASRGTPIERTVFMECDVDEPHALDEARHVQSLAVANPLIAGIIASGRPERGGFGDHLDALAKLPKVRGLRRVLHTQPDGLSRSKLFVDNIRLLARHGFTFDVVVQARQLPVAAELIRSCPGVTFVLDHCGVPDVKGKALDPWRAHIETIAALPNAVCKVSGIVAYAEPERWTVEDLRPFFDRVVASFGYDRVVWGGDWPVVLLGGTLKSWVEATLALTAGASEADREKLFWRNAERVYRL